MKLKLFKPDTAKAPPPFKKFVAASVGTLLLVLTIGWLTLFGILETIQKRQFGEVSQVAGNIVRLHSQYVQTTVDRLVTLMQLQDSAALPQLLELLSDTEQGMVLQVGRFSAQGVLQQGSGWLAQGANISASAFFRQHQAQPSSALLFTPPTLPSDKPVIHVSRRISRSDGGFDGVSVVAVPVDYFIRYFLTTNLLPGNVQMVATLDGSILARVRDKVSVPGTVRATLPLIAQILEGKSSGYGVFRSQTDGIERSYYYQTVPGYPLFVMFGLSTENIQARTEMARNALIRLGLLISGLMLTTTLALIYFEIRRHRYLAEQTRLLHELQVKDERWEAALAGSNDGIWDWNADTNQIYISARAMAELGYPAKAETFDMSAWLQMIHPDDQQDVTNAFMQNRRGLLPIFSTEHRHQCADRSYKWFFARGKASFDQNGKVVRAAGSTTNITTQRLLADKVRDYTAQLDALFTMSTDGYVTFDADGKVNYQNPAFQKMTGLAPEMLHGLDAVRFQTLVSGLCASARPFPPLNVLRQTSASTDGPDHVLVELLAPAHIILQTSLKTVDEKQLTQVLYFRDVTQSTQLEEMKSDFLATAAHELRTPMTNVMGFAELLNMRDFDTAERNEFHSLILKNSQRMVDILDELLDLSRIESGGHKDIHLTRVNLRDVVQGLLDSFILPEGREAPLVVLPDLYCHGDSRKVSQIVLNILSNAYKYSAGQGGHILITRAVSAAAEDASLVGITIQDQGMGMAPQHLARIYERFYRVDKSCNTPGTGLGMSIVKELMDLMNGRVLIDSTPGQGTTVTLLFPADLTNTDLCSGCDAA